MKYLTLITAASAFALTACAPEAEDKVENAYEEKADNLEERADEIREVADEKADALEAKADQVDALADPMGDRVEDGALDKSEAMPGNVIDNAENNIEETAQ